MTKTCSKCQLQLPLAQFSVDNKRKDGRDSYCRDCKHQYRAKQWKRIKSNPEKYEKERVSAMLRKLKFRYQLPPEENEVLLKERLTGHCAICGSTKRLNIDHCHKTGKIRGVLCNQCNSGLGFLKDSKDLLQKALEYLG